MRRQFGIRWMARLLLVCMLVGLIPTGVFAIEGDSSSLAEDAPEYRRADTATEQALKSAINSLAAPVYTHNEKVNFYGTSQDTFRKEADGSSYFFVNPHAGTEDLLVLPENGASGKGLKTDADFSYGNMGKTLLGVTPAQAWTFDHNNDTEVSHFLCKGYNGNTLAVTTVTLSDSGNHAVEVAMVGSDANAMDYGLYSASTGLVGFGIFMWITIDNVSTRFMLSTVNGEATFVNNHGAAWSQDAKGMMDAYELVSMEELAELKAVLTQAAQKMNGAQYDEELYHEFLNYVDNSIDIYKQSNRYIETDDMNDIYEVRDLLRERTETLQEYLDALEISALSTQELVATLKTDVAGVAASTAGVYNNQLNMASLDLATLRGSFFIATKYNGWKIMDGDSTVGRVSGGRPAANLKNESPYVWIESMADGSPLNEAKAWNVFSYGQSIQGDGISMVFSMYRNTVFSAAKNSDSIVVDNVSFTSGTLSKADDYTLQVYPATEDPNWGVKIYDTVDGVKYFLCLINHSDPAYVRYMWIAESEISNYDKTQYIFYLFSHWNTNKLKTAITDAGALLDGDTTGYSKAIYDRFLRSLNSAVTLYNTYNKNEERRTVSYEEFVQDKLDRMTNELYGYITLLTSEEKYIDIPVEIIDFRADGLLIENVSPFDLLRDGLKDPTTGELSPVLPGNLGIPGVDGTGNYREGLTYGILVNDNFVYREEVIDYVAQGILLEGSMKEPRWKAALGSTQVIETRVEELLTSQNKGSMADTVQKLHGSIGANDQGLPTWAGGTLYWSQVKTAYDLAYYVLSNLWSEVETGDVTIDGQVYTNRMEDGYYYNMTVPERSTLRMYMDENGEYALDAAYPVGYAGSYIMNAEGAEEDLDWVTTTSTTDGPDGQKTQGTTDDPLFAPIDGLGFEKDGVIPGNADTDRGSISNVVFYSKPSFDSNYHYTMHAYASFVYYEDQNQVFTFRGDDDVHFYINGKMAMDLGGAHTPVGEELELREHAEELGLVDGNTYRFDMFYAERAATGSNLLFSTNIKINDTDTRTEKMQYANTFGGTDQIGEDGRGSLLGDNAMMNIGDKVDYSFDIINTRKVPVFDISFRDESLGISISSEAITLPDTMSITDLRVYYEPVDAEGNSSDDLPVAVTVADIERLIQAAIASQNGGDDPSKITLDKNYVVSIATAKELQDLLSLGIPAYCRISVYGFRRTMEEGDRPYMNTLESLCHYRQSADPETAALKGDVFPISATVSRLLQVPDVNVVLPTADVEEIVIDYGKAVHIPMDELAAHVYGNAKAVVGEFAGLTAQGKRNGELLKNAPGDLNSNSLATEEGLFTVKNGDLVYEPRTILTDVDKVYAAYNLSGCYGMDASGTSSVQYRYILVEIRITPATMMYYEAEDFTSDVNTVKQTTDDTATNREEWGTVSDGTALLDINPDDLPEGAFFVDFDGRGYHDRYKKDELYGDCDFDDMNYWASLGSATDGSEVSTKLTVDKDQGELSFKVSPTADTTGNYGPCVGTTRGSNIYPHGGLSSVHSYYPLNYRPQKTTYIQMRFKAENCEWAGDFQWIDFLYNYNKNGESIYSETAKAYIGLSYAVKEDGVYQTVCCEIPEDHAFYTADWIESFAFRFKGLKGTGSANGTITIDYIYVGTKPEKQQDFSRVEDTVYDMVMDRESIPSDAFYVDFDGEGYGARYKNGRQYGGYNFDEESAWYSHHVYDTSYNTHTLNEKAGTMELSNLTSTDEKGNPLGAWIQTIIPGKALGTTPLRLNAGQEHIAQIRFRVENCVSYNNDGNISLFFSSTSDSENSDKNVALDSRRARFALSHADVTKGDYITARFSLDNSYYANSDTIDIIRLYIAGYKDNPTDNKTGKIIIDYIYVGPKVGLPEDLEQHSRIDSREEYLFFDFTDTAADRLRYESPQYNGFNFDLVDNWEGRTTGWKDGTEFAADGTMTVRAGTEKYSSIYIDTCVANGDDTRLLNYNAANAEVFQIRFRASNLIDSDGNVGAQIQFYADSSTEFKGSANGVGADGTFDVKYLTNGEYYTVTGKITQAQRDLGTIKRIIVWIGNLDNTVNPAGTVTFDHVYVGPQDILDNINRELAEKEAKENTSDYLFFTFNNTDTDKLRYESPQYNSINFDSAANWEGRTTSYKDGTETVSNGAITVKAGQTGYSSIYIDSAVKNNDSTRALNYDPSNAEVFQIRFKASNLDKGTGSFGAEVQFYWDFGTSYKRSEKAKFDAKYLTNGEYITVTGKITDEQRALGIVPRIIVWIGDFGTSTDTTGAVTFDHVYVGPRDKLEEINKLLAEEEEAKNSEYLFFDFNNTGEDQLRYTAPQYNGFNFDLVANWEGRTSGWKDGTESITNGGLTVRAGGTNSYSSIYADTCVANGNNTRLLNYNAANAEVFQIRFKASNLKGTTGNFGAEVQLYADSSESYKRSEKAKFDVKYLSNGEYITVSGRITDEQRKLGTVKRIIVWIGDMDSQSGTAGTVTFDHVYIGPADRLEEINRKLAGTAEGEPSDHLFFGFDNTQMDTLRYSSPTYGVINHDSTANWYAEGNGVETIENGTVTFTDTVVNGYTYLSMGDKKLHYVIGEEDYCQIRFKISNDAQDTTPNDGQVSIALMFTTEKKTEVEGASAGYTYFKLDDYKGKGFVTLTFPLGNNDPAYAPGEILTFIRPQFGTGLDGGSYTIDYIYVGPLVDANPAQRSLFFDFDNTGDDRNRYNTDAYGFINYDETGNWTVNPDRDKSVTVDSDASFLVVDPDENNENSFKEFSYFNTGSSNTYSWAYADCPLDFHPSAATVAQVRFKITGICMEPGAVSEAVDPFTKRTKTEPYVQLRYFYDHNPLTDNPIAGTGFASAEALNQGEFVTVTFALDDAFRNCNIVSAIRPSFHRMGGNIIVDYIYVGPGELAPDPVYGYDSSYENDSLLSDGNSLFVEGNGIQNASGTAKEYTEASFSFKGTGFDIISRTGKMQATIRVEVKDNATGKAVKALTVNNKGELELYQIPVVSVQGLPHGEYTVTLWVNKAVNSIYDFLSRGGEFYLDGIRIYDTVCVDGDKLTDTQQAALNAYETDKEAYNYIKEVRNILLSADEFYALTDTVQGAVFVDVNSPTVNPYPTEEQGTEGEPEVTQPTTPPYISTEGYNAMTVLTYNKLGPKNEVYLAPDQAIAFMLQIDTARKPVSIDIGAKTIQGDPVTLAAGFVSTKKTDAPETLTAVLKEISTSTAQYYALDETKVSAGDTVYLVLYNATKKTAGLGETDKVLSITDIKIAYDGHPDTPLPEDQITDKEVFPTAPSESTDGDDSTDTGSDSTGGNGSGSGSGSNSGGASGAGIKMLIGGDAVSAVRSFMVAIHETPVAEPEEPETPALQGDMRIYHSLNLASDISVNFLVPKADLAGFDLSTVYMECRKETFDGNKRAGYTTVRLEPVEKGEYYYFTLTGLTAVNMNDRIYTTLYGVKDGQEYYSATDDYSITDYAYAQLGKAGIPESLKILCADLLRYGAKAQIFKSYRTDRLADADLTEEQRAYLSDINTVTFGNTNKMMEDLDNAPIVWVGKALNLESKVAVKFIFAPASYSGDVGGLTLHISYEDAQGNAKTLTLGDPELYNEEKGYYAFTLDTLLAAELRTVISARIYSGNTPVSATLQYSPDTYGNNKTGTLLDLCKALFAYSDSAKAYFAN